MEPLELPHRRRPRWRLQEAPETKARRTVRHLGWLIRLAREVEGRLGRIPTVGSMPRKRPRHRNPPGSWCSIKAAAALRVCWQATINDHVKTQDAVSASSRAAGSDIGLLLRGSKPGSRQRRKLLWNLTGAPAPTGTDLLRVYLDSSDARDGVAAVQALERIGTGEASSTLRDGLTTAPPLVASYIARVLLKRGARSELPAIIAVLHDRADELDTADKQFVIDAMRKAPHVSAVPVLAETLRDRHWGLRKSAARALLAIGAPESVAALQTAADELGFWKGRQARHALRMQQA
jgi:hypothetical protein